MELEAAKMIGAGLAAIALAGAGVGIGIIFGNYLSGAMRNPSAAQKQFPNLLLGFALAEARKQALSSLLPSSVTRRRLWKGCKVLSLSSEVLTP
jgi:F-type H+-transporting ATPase subunit c